MAKVTKITVQKRNKSRYNLYIDRGQGEEYALSLDEDLLITYGIRKGLEIDEERLATLVDEDEQKKAYHLAIHFLSYRMRSVEEIRSYLEKKEKEERHIAAVIEKLKEQRLLNDREFAQAYINTKKVTVTKGPLKLKQELVQKGVHSADIDLALDTFDEQEQVNQVQKWIDKQKNRNHKQSVRAFADKLANQLMAKGYPRSVIVEAMQHANITNEDDDEWEAICYQGEKVVRKYKNKYDGWEFKQRVKQALYTKRFSMELIEKFLAKIEENK
ncbi:recombination regulator RecX [bacterium LRH843]|nr:recombination regulator RecX [bacterium LRH843]